MSIINNMPVKGGMDINGLIQEYYVYAGENISAGSFVEFIEGIGSETIATSSRFIVDDTSSKRTLAWYIDAIALDNNRVFIAYSSLNSYTPEDYRLKGIVLTINGVTIEKGVMVIIESIFRTGSDGIKLKLLDNNKVLVFYTRTEKIQNSSGTYTSSDSMGYTDLTISGTTITVGSVKVLISGNVDEFDITEISSTKMFISFALDWKLYASVLTISETSVSKSSNVALSSTAYSGTGVNNSLFPNGNIIVSHRYPAENYGVGCIIVSISGTSISKGTDTEISQEGCDSHFKVIALSDTKAFIVYPGNSTDCMFGKVLTVSGRSITSQGTSTQLDNQAGYDEEVPRILNFSEGKLLILYRDSSPYILRQLVVSISNSDAITVDTAETLVEDIGGTCTIPIPIQDNMLIIGATYNYLYLWGQVFDIDYENNRLTNQVLLSTNYETQVRNTTTNTPNGVAKVGGEGGSSTLHKDKITIYVPDI